MNNIIVVTIGDINGIGIEILINCWKKNKINKRFVLLTNINIFKRYINKKKIKIDFIEIKNIHKDLSKINFKKKLHIHNIKAKNQTENMYNSLKESYKLTKLEYFNGILTLPINKEKIIKKIDKKFTGQTEFFQKLDNSKNANMIFANKKLIFLTLTNHLPLKDVIGTLKRKNYMYNKIISFNKTLIRDFNIKNPIIYLGGINPHAGENGFIGNEEITFVKKTIKRLKAINVNINGPFSSDSLITKKNIKNVDAFIFNYHDQALIPFKLLDDFSGINFTGGINIIRVSPDHGTAYNMIGSKETNNQSIINCFKYLNKIIRNRKNYC